MSARPTVQSLARELGVSRQTISNALNRPEVVAPATLERVLAHIEKSGYVPSRAARQLREARSRQLAIRMLPTFDGINGHILDAFLHGLVESAGARGYRLGIFAATSIEDELAQYRELLAAREADGVVLTATTLDDPRIAQLQRDGVPFVAFGRPWSLTVDPYTVPFSWVDVDGSSGTQAVVEALVAAGHRRIGYVSWPIAPGVGEDRFRGWKRAMEAAGLPTDGFVRECEDDAQKGAEAALELRQAGATAILCASDTLGVGVRAVLRDSDCIVVGFDDTPVSRALGLNSVRQPVAAVAEQCTAALVARLRGDESPRHVLLPAEPVFRQDISHPPVRNKKKEQS